jgi:hypothetical protein
VEEERVSVYEDEDEFEESNDKVVRHISMFEISTYKVNMRFNKFISIYERIENGSFFALCMKQKSYIPVKQVIRATVLNHLLNQ